MLWALLAAVPIVQMLAISPKHIDNLILMTLDQVDGERKKTQSVRLSTVLSAKQPFAGQFLATWKSSRGRRDNDQSQSRHVT